MQVWWECSSICLEIQSLILHLLSSRQLDCYSIAVKRIVRYLIETKDHGLVFKPSLDWKVDCYVDADFCGLWRSDYPMIQLLPSPELAMWFPWLAALFCGWVPCKQRLKSPQWCQSMWHWAQPWDMLPLKRLVKPIAKMVTGDINIKVTTKSDVFEGNNRALAVATLSRITPQSNLFAVKLHFFCENVKTKSNPQSEIHIHMVDIVNQLGDMSFKGLPHGLGHKPSLTWCPNLHSRGSVEKVRLVCSVFSIWVLKSRWWFEVWINELSMFQSGESQLTFSHKASLAN